MLPDQSNQNRLPARPAYRTGALAAALAVMTAIRFYVGAHTGLSGDEAYYRLWSLGPALSYLDHPPFIAWIIAWGRGLAGDTTLGVRLLGPLIAVVGTIVVFRTAELLFDREMARKAAWFLLAMPLLSVGTVIVTPDLPSVLFYGLVVLCLAELDRTQNPNWWLAVGVCAGLGLVSKYTNLFAGAAIVLWLALVPQNRRWFATPQLWFGGLIAGLIFAPVLAWNARNGWSSFSKQFGRVGETAGFNPVYFLEFLGSYAGLASPVIAGLAVVGLCQIVGRARRSGSSRDWLIVCSVLPMLGYFAFHSLHGRVQANWLAPIYPLLAMTAATGLSAIRDQAQRRRVALFAVAFGLATTLVIFVHAVHPILPLKKDPVEQMRGWPSFGDAVDRVRIEHGAKWLAVAHYTTAGELAFALKDRVPVVPLTERIRYENRPEFSLAMAAAPALFVELERRVDEAALRACFSGVRKLPDIARKPDSGSPVAYIAYLLTGMIPNCQMDGLSEGPLRVVNAPVR